jgi:hypothetical protein
VLLPEILARSSLPSTVKAGAGTHRAWQKPHNLHVVR